MNFVLLAFLIFNIYLLIKAVFLLESYTRLNKKELTGQQKIVKKYFLEIFIGNLLLSIILFSFYKDEFLNFIK